MSEYYSEQVPTDLSLSVEEIEGVHEWFDAVGALKRFEAARDATIANCAFYGDEDPGYFQDVLALEELSGAQIPWAMRLNEPKGRAK